MVALLMISLLMVLVLVLFFLLIGLLRRNQEMFTLQQDIDKEVRLIKNIRDELLLRNGTHQLGEVKIALSCIPYGRVGSDYWDVFSLEKRKIGVIIADVSGHGLTSGLVCLLLQFWFEHFKQKRTNPISIIEQINGEFYRIFYRTGFYFTVIYSLIDLDTGQVNSVSAGHPSPLLIHSLSGEVTSLIHAKDTNLIVGVDENISFCSSTIYLKKEHVLLYYTDGLKEAQNKAGDFYGINRLMDFSRKHASLSPKYFVQQLIKTTNDFQGNMPLKDDKTILALKWK